jgi:hypothetical protein
VPQDDVLRPLLDAQHNVLSREQATGAGLTRRAIDHRLRRGLWQRLLPGVYLVQLGRPSRRQAQIAALLFAGEGAALDDVDACEAAGLRAMSCVEGVVFVVVPRGSPARSHDFVRIRQTQQPFVTFWASGTRRCLEPAAALVAMSRRVRDQTAVLAAFSEAVQRRVVTLDRLESAHLDGPRKNRQAAEQALFDLGAGVRSVPERGFRRLAVTSLVLPPLLYNRRLRLPTGRIVVPDALALEAGLVHETNGRGPHAREDLFESMQERHDAMTAAGLVVLHNSPRRIRISGPLVIAEFEECYRINVGRGLPPGVELLPD